MKKPILPLVSYITLATTFALMLLVGFWCFYPYQPIVFTKPAFPLVSGVVRAGGTLQYISEYTKNTNTPAHVSRNFINDLVFVTSPTTSNRPVGDNTFLISIKVPQELPAGKYYLRNTYTYQVNPIREVTVVQDTEESVVVE